MLSQTCRNCGGTLDYDEDREVGLCPTCAVSPLASMPRPEVIDPALHCSGSLLDGQQVIPWTARVLESGYLYVQIGGEFAAQLPPQFPLSAECVPDEFLFFPEWRRRIVQMWWEKWRSGENA